jgi:diguanylate cyclase (GGDEF)-like protein
MSRPAATILIVDDEIQNRKLLEALLRPEGYVTQSAASGEEALASIGRQAPDLILLDIMMPGMDGHQLAGILKADPATANIPIIMVTALIDRGTRLAGLNAGAEEFLTKPVDRAELWLRVRNLLRLKEFGDFLKNHSAMLEQQVEERTSDIRRLNRVYAVLSGINNLIVRVRDRDELFREACRIAVEDGALRAAWIGIIDRSSMEIVPLESAGMEQAFPAAMAARVIREKKAAVSDDAGTATLPLVVADEAVGVLTLHSAEAGFFDEKEMKLLNELAGDIAFAIDHIEKQEQLDYLAYYDVLTGLANRNLFLERVAPWVHGAAAGRHKLALFMIDLERFKNLNDSLGQPAGDALLRQVAEWLTRSMDDATLLARVGPDRFAVVLPDVRQEGDVARLIEKTMSAFQEHPFQLDGAAYRIAAKVGVAVYPDDGADAETLFKNAEAALKKAKAVGDRYLFYTQRMTEAIAGRVNLENQLRHALDNGEFVLYYQPKVSVNGAKLASAEALIRWDDPRTGLVPPGRFISILEETGLIHEVGRWAMRKAVDDHLRWRKAGLEAVRVAVNVSPLQLRNRHFIDEVRQAVAVDAHAAAGLELEITESLIMEDVEHNIASLRAIREMGVRIAIDDFGTGFSSLSYLSILPVDTLKIDRSFVIGMTGAPEGLALVSTIITLAHSLKLKVVAEGVETEEQSRLLLQMHCDEMQGFLFSKPVPCDVFEARYLATQLAA